MSKHNAMVLCNDHKKVACSSCDAIIKEIRSIVREVDTKHGRLNRIAKLLGMTIDD